METLEWEYRAVLTRNKLTELPDKESEAIRKAYVIQKLRYKHDTDNKDINDKKDAELNTILLKRALPTDWIHCPY